MRKGFTLIELLIVIAIIAILALIAVPNFLEAQVRSKVARCYADMRSCLTGIEAYAVDWGREPISPVELQVNYNITNSSGGTLGAKVSWARLTTPVAYMTFMPVDPFTDKGVETKDGAKYWVRRPFAYRTYFDQTKDWDKLALANGYRYMFHSYGPTRSNVKPEDPTSGSSPTGVLIGRNNYIYDPSNGTVSFGSIIATNKGIMQRIDQKNQI